MNSIQKSYKYARIALMSVLLALVAGCTAGIQYGGVEHDVESGVKISNFTATQRNGCVELEWTTEFEWKCRGFYIVKTTSNGKEVRVNDINIEPGKYSYHVVDRNLKMGIEYRYTVVDINDFDVTYHYDKSIIVRILKTKE